MKLFRLFAVVLCTGMLVLGTTSCKKDDDSNGDCCTIDTEKICKDDAEFKESGLDWDAYKALVALGGGSCD